MKSGRDEVARGSIPGSSPRPDREHRKPQPTTCYTVVCVKTAVEISEESRKIRAISAESEESDTMPEPGRVRRVLDDAPFPGDVFAGAPPTQTVRLRELDAPYDPNDSSASPRQRTGAACDRPGNLVRCPLLTYDSTMRFLETPIFTEAVEELLDHDGYYALQSSLILRPDRGRRRDPPERRTAKNTLGPPGQRQTWRMPHHILLG